MIAAELCRQFEGFRAKPYLCPAGVATIGYGSTMYEDGKRVSLEDVLITKERAEELLQLTLAKDYLPGVLKASPVLLGHPRRLAAITDFAYNLGVGRYRASTLKRRIDAQEWDAASVELLKWVRGGGQVLPGLVKRRYAEAALVTR